jgi:hypothetical protein
MRPKIKDLLENVQNTRDGETVSVVYVGKTVHFIHGYSANGVSFRLTSNRRRDFQKALDTLESTRPKPERKSKEFNNE